MSYELASSEFDDVLEIIAPLAAGFADSGYQLYLVGGVVRDLIVGGHGALDDIDLTTDAHPKEIKRLLESVSQTLWAQGEKFGTIGAIVNGRDLEITTHRAETYDSESRKPEVVFGDDLETDLSRRDFTINAMAFSVVAKELLDPFGGLADLEARVLRTPDNPEISFIDDPLRMLRAARFIPRFELSVDPGLEKSVTKLGERLSIVSSERVHDELERLLGVEEPSLGFDFLERTGLLDFIVPGLDPGVRDLACVLASLSGSVLVRRAGLIVLLGVPDAGSWLRSLRYSTADRHLTIRLIEGANLILDSTSSAADIRRLVALVGVGHVGETMDLARNVAGVLDADSDAGGDAGTSLGIGSGSGSVGSGSVDSDSVGLPSRLAARVGGARSVFLELGMTENLANLTGPVSGGELIAELGLTPGPIVGQAVAMLAEHRLAHGPFDKSEAFDMTRTWLAEPKPD